MWKKEKRFVVYVIHTLLHWKVSPSSNSSVKTPTGSSWIDLPQNFDLRFVSPQNFHPLPSQWQAITVGWWLTYYESTITNVLGKDSNIFFSPYVSILSVNYMKINMFRVQRDAPRRITIVCLLTIYVHLIKFILRKSVWDYLFREETNSFFWKVGFISFSQQGVERFTVPAFSGSITRDRKRSNIQGSKETVPLMMNNTVNLTSWEVNSRRFKGMYSSLE